MDLQESAVSSMTAVQLMTQGFIDSGTAASCTRHMLQRISVILTCTQSADVLIYICGECPRIYGHGYLWIALEMRDALVAEHEHAAARTCATHVRGQGQVSQGGQGQVS